MSLIVNFIPPKHREKRKLKFSYLLILYVNLGAIIYMMGLSALFWKLDFTFGINTACPSIIAALLFFAVIRFSNSVLFNGCYFILCSLVIFTTISLGTGGVHSPFMPWFLTIPAAIFFYIKRKYALPWVLLTLVCVIFLAVASILKIEVAEPLSDEAMIGLRITNFMIITFVLVRIVQSFRYSYRYVNKKLSKTVEKLETTNEDLQNFAYIASHDLQTPLKSINSTIKALKIHQKSQDREADAIEAQCLDFVENSTDRLANLVEDILNYSRAGQLEPTLETVDLNQIIEEIRQQVMAAKQYPEFVIKSVTLPSVVTDRSMIFQLFQNIIENGLKYNDSKHPAILIDLAPDMQFDHLTFTDNGIGIKAEDQEKVFGMFSRVGETQKYEGTGIGLAICKRIMDQSGGKLWLTSTPGEGTVFHVEISKQEQTLTLSTEKKIQAGNEIEAEKVNK